MWRNVGGMKDWKKLRHFFICFMLITMVATPRAHLKPTETKIHLDERKKQEVGGWGKKKTQARISDYTQRGAKTHPPTHAN